VSMSPAHSVFDPCLAGRLNQKMRPIDSAWPARQRIRRRKACPDGRWSRRQGRRRLCV